MKEKGPTAKGGAISCSLGGRALSPGTPVHAGQTTPLETGRKRPGGPGGHQDEHEPAMCCQQVEGCDLSPLNG